MNKRHSEGERRTLEDLDRIAAEASQRADEQKSALWPDPIDLEALAERDPQPPKFIIDDWLPEGYATLFAGHGGVGKSIIALHLAVCIAAGEPFFGLEVQRRRVLYLSCEDRADVLHWRLSRICGHLGISLASLRGWLDVIDLVGHPSLVWERDPRSGAALTPAFMALQSRVQDQQTQVLFGDGVADLFGGNENARCEVKAFVNAVLAEIPLDGALILLGHIDKLSAMNGASGAGYSGSTGWNNAVRARWYLYPEQELDGDDERERTGCLVLDLKKSNHGEADHSLRFTWNEEARLFLADGLLLSARFDRRHQESTERMAVLRALKACHDAQIVVPAATQGPRTAFNSLGTRADMPATLRNGRKGRQRFWRCVEQLRQDGLVEERLYTREDRHKAMQLVLTNTGLRDAGLSS